MLADRPLSTDSDDRLGFAAYADALAEVIDNPKTDTPLTIAISAPWGAGKTTLAMMVERRLRQAPLLRGDRPHIICWFYPWLHDDAPHLGAAFAAHVAKTVSPQRRLWARVLFPLPMAMLSASERWWRRLRLAGLALVAAVGIAVVPGVRKLFASEIGFLPEVESAFEARFGSIAVVLFALFGAWTRLLAAAQSAANFVDSPRSEAARGSMHEVREQVKG